MSRQMLADFHLQRLVEVLGASAVGIDGDIRCSGVSTDTRHIEKGDLFVALKGPRFDAHDYVGDAIGKGAVAAVVDHAVDQALPQLVVADTLSALGELGAHNRLAFAGPVFAVTGSSGKTSVKEMLASMLATRGQVMATRGNLNNEIGVPLTLLRLSGADQFAVIELGASALGEIARTTAMAMPQVAILTNVQGAHLEGFGSLENIVQAKGEIFQGLSEGGCGVVNADDPYADVWLKKLETLGRRFIRFSVDGRPAEIQVSSARLGDNGCWTFNLEYRGEAVPVQLAVMGRHNLSNAAAAAAAWVAAGLPLKEAVAGLQAFKPVAGRLSPLRLSSGALLVDDSYNANPGSVRAAIDVLASLPGPRTLILGDMAELGDEAANLHGSLGDYAGTRGIERVWSTGNLSRHVTERARLKGCDCEHFDDFQGLVAALHRLDLTSGTLLIKGSRSAGMDRAVKALQDGEK